MSASTDRDADPPERWRPAARRVRSRTDPRPHAQRLAAAGGDAPPTASSTSAAEAVFESDEGRHLLRRQAGADRRRPCGSAAAR